jgi:hypothetical protein
MRLLFVQSCAGPDVARLLIVRVAIRGGINTVSVRVRWEGGGPCRSGNSISRPDEWERSAGFGADPTRVNAVDTMSKRVRCEVIRIGHGGTGRCERESRKGRRQNEMFEGQPLHAHDKCFICLSKTRKTLKIFNRPPPKSAESLWLGIPMAKSFGTLGKVDRGVCLRAISAELRFGAMLPPMRSHANCRYRLPSVIRPTEGNRRLTLSQPEQFNPTTDVRDFTDGFRRDRPRAAGKRATHRAVN